MLTAIAVTALAITGLAGSALAGKPSKEQRCAAKAKNHRDRLDCKDAPIGNRENPKRQRYNGKAFSRKTLTRCDILDRTVCLQPWPNDYYTVASGSTDSGRKVNLDRKSMPANSGGTTIDATDYNRADGFSPGQLIVTKVPGLDTPTALAKTDPVGLTDLHAYTEPKQPIVVIDAQTGQRWPIWVELDSNATTAKATNVLIRPAVNFTEGHRYIVAMRGLKNGHGKTLKPASGFRLYRDRLITKQKPIERRRGHMEKLFRQLKQAGVRRGSLYLAWDFTVASADSIAGRALAMRDDAFAELGDTNLGDGTVSGNSPAFTITNVDVPDLCSAGPTSGCDDSTPNDNDIQESDTILRVIDGTINVPCYLDTQGCPPGAQFAFANANSKLPTFNPSFRADVPFRCIIPDSVADGGPIAQARPLLFGHGLLQNRFVVNQTGTLDNAHNVLPCAMNFEGFSTDDVSTGILPSLGNLSKFPKIADASQQGFVNFMLLGRAMLLNSGLGSSEAFQVDPDNPRAPYSAPADPNTDLTMNTGKLFYFGVSNGSIMGGSLTALAPDFERAVLNVPGMNYSTLLTRSTHWDEFSPFLYANYKKEIERPLILSAIQMLWDRAETNGYAEHMTDHPYPNTPAHKILMQVSYGDHQVTNFAAEVEARTAGVSIMTPALDPGRPWDSDPFLGIPAIGTYPFTGSAMVYWDGGPIGYTGPTGGAGTAMPPLTNTIPATALGYGGDPHGYIVADAGAGNQISDFLQGSGFLNQCPGGKPCYSNGWTGAP